MSGFGSTPTTTTETPLATDQIYISSVATPNTANGDLTALEGGPVSTDSNSNKTAPASVWVKDGGDVTGGAKADTAITDATTTNTKMSFLKGLVKMVADIWDNANHRIRVDGSGVTQPVSGSVSVNTISNYAAESGGNLAAAKADLDTIVTNTNKIPASPAQEAGNLATAVTRLTSILSALQGLLQVEQADLSTSGTLSAAQPVIGTPVTNATVQLTVGQGQSTWKALLSDGGGGFTAGSTIVADKSIDGGTTWTSASFKVTGASPATTQSSVVGPGPLELTGVAAGLTHVRIRCSVRGGTESIAVVLRAGAGVADVGIISSIPAGANNIGTLAPFVDTPATGTVTNDNDVVSIALPGGQSTVLINVLMNTLVGTLLFEASPDSGTTWVAVNGSQAGTSSVATSTTTAGVWRVGVAGFTNFRVRLHPVTSGTSGTLTLRVTQGVNNVTVVNSAVLGQQVSASSTSVVVASDQSAIPVKGTFTEQTALTAGSLNADLVAALDITGYAAWGLHITGTWTGTLSIQGSNDNVTFSPVFATYQTTLGGTLAVVTTTQSNGVFLGTRAYRYLRVRMTSYTSGTANAVLELFTVAPPAIVAAVAAYQFGTWTVQPGNTQNTTPWLVAGPTLTAAQAANTAGNVVVKGSAGALWSAVVTAVGTAQLDIFDNASTNAGTKLLSIPANAPVGSIYSFPGGQPAASGIVSNGVTNCPAVTFGYR